MRMKKIYIFIILGLLLNVKCFGDITFKTNKDILTTKKVTIVANLPEYSKYDTIFIPDSLLYNKKNYPITEIGSSAFTVGCSSSIVKPTSSKNKYEIKPMKCAMEGMGINSVELPDTLEIVEYDAFYGNNLKSITIPKRVKEIKYNAFANNKLQSVTFEGNVNNISIDCDAFRGDEHSKKVNSIGGVCK